MNTLALSSRLVASLARVGIAAVDVTGPQGVRERLRLAMGGELGEGESEALAVELDALAELLAPGWWTIEGRPPQAIAPPAPCIARPCQ